MDSQVQPAETPEPSTYKIDGKEYTADQLNEALRGSLREKDYTQKTQALSEWKRQQEEELAEREAAIAERERRTRYQSEDERSDDDPWVNRFNSLETSVKTLAETIQRREAVESEEMATQRAVREINAALDEFAGHPGYDRAEMLGVMQRKGWQTAADVETAYELVARPKIERARAEKDVMSRNGAAPPVMGGTGYRMTAPFSDVGGAAPGFDPKESDWDDLARMALNDPNAPR
jgi:hypothetical protein